jgi:hypothetical protein
MSVSPLLGYFDPGSGSLVMQAIVGGTAGLFVFAKYLWTSAPSLFAGRKSRSNSEQS